ARLIPRRWHQDNLPVHQLCLALHLVKVLNGAPLLDAHCCSPCGIEALEAVSPLSSGTLPGLSGNPTSMRLFRYPLPPVDRHRATGCSESYAAEQLYSIRHKVALFPKKSLG